ADLDPDDLPEGAGAAAALKASFLASAYADLDPVCVEAPFQLVVGDHLVRGRIDAVYERDGRLELVDFKTGLLPAEGDAGAGTQLELYALAAAQTWREPAARLRTSYCWLHTEGGPDVVSRDWDDDALTLVRDGVVATLDALAARQFAATAGPWCRRCDFL